MCVSLSGSSFNLFKIPFKHEATRSVLLDLTNNRLIQERLHKWRDTLLPLRTQRVNPLLEHVWRADSVERQRTGTATDNGTGAATVADVKWNSREMGLQHSKT